MVNFFRDFYRNFLEEIDVFSSKLFFCSFTIGVQILPLIVHERRARADDDDFRFVSIRLYRFDIDKMGLCKCPLRKVSTLFCFKHHVNVCESCLVNEHPRCIVRSYVSWLQDNDFNPNCSLCQRSLTDTNDETIRLVCYDLFHWSCLNEYFQSFPSHTAPDGYTCPTCHTCVFPPSNLVSPVADQVRTKFSQASWANRLPNLSATTTTSTNEKNNLLTETEKNGYVIVDPTTTSSSGLSHHPNRSTDMTINSSSTSSTTVKIEHSDPDDEDKYARRSVFTWFARWLKSRQPRRGKPTTNLPNRTSSIRTTIYLILTILFVFITMIVVLYHLTRGDNNEQLNSESDPQFNPFNNPFIRVGGRFLKNPLRDSPQDLPRDIEDARQA